jgi:hypothetical protein
MNLAHPIRTTWPVHQWIRTEPNTNVITNEITNEMESIPGDLPGRRRQGRQERAGDTSETGRDHEAIGMPLPRWRSRVRFESRRPL